MSNRANSSSLAVNSSEGNRVHGASKGGHVAMIEWLKERGRHFRKITACRIRLCRARSLRLTSQRPHQLPEQKRFDVSVDISTHPNKMHSRA